MTRKGRECEIIVKDLERLLVGKNFKITSPDYIMDKVTGVLREVDISIKGKIGSHNILIIIECRDRTATQDVTWIEQVINKTNSLNANKVVVVSTSSFTKPAIRKAKFAGIEIRLLKSFDPKDIIKWIKNVKVEFFERRFNLKDVKLAVTDASYDKVIDPSKLKDLSELGEILARGRDKVFEKPDGLKLSLNSIIFGINIQNNNLFFGDIKPDLKPVLKKFELLIYDPSQRLFINFKDTKYRVFKLFVEAEFFINEVNFSSEKFQRYESENKILAERLEYSWKIREGKEIKISFQKDLEKKKQNVVFMIKNSK